MKGVESKHYKKITLKKIEKVKEKKENNQKLKTKEKRYFWYWKLVKGQIF